MSFALDATIPFLLIESISNFNRQLTSQDRSTPVSIFRRRREESAWLRVPGGEFHIRISGLPSTHQQPSCHKPPCAYCHASLQPRLPQASSAQHDLRQASSGPLWPSRLPVFRRRAACFNRRELLRALSGRFGCRSSAAGQSASIGVSFFGLHRALSGRFDCRSSAAGQSASIGVSFIGPSQAASAAGLPPPGSLLQSA
jgi:hypothetical protein